MTGAFVFHEMLALRGLLVGGFHLPLPLPPSALSILKPMNQTGASTNPYLVVIETGNDAPIKAAPGLEITERFEFDGLSFDILAIEATEAAAQALRSYSAVESVDADDFTVAPTLGPPTRIDDASAREPETLADSVATIEDVRSLHNIPSPDSDESLPTGEGVTVCAMDSGIDPSHPVFDGVSIHQEDVSGSGPGDTVGHGSAVLGQITQIAPDADLVSLRIFGSKGRTDGVTVMRAYEWLHKHSEAIDVANMSWGTSEPVAAIDRVHDALVDKGVRTCEAAGNSGDKSGSPATAARAFSAAACDEHGSIASFSSYNPERDNPDVAAIGVDNRLAQAEGTRMGRQLPGQWVMASGTSFSAPELAGMVALFLDAKPNASPRRIMQAFENGARDIESTPKDGAGLADYGNAMDTDTSDHESERTFQDALLDFFRGRYGTSSVEREKYLTDTHNGEKIIVGYADFWIESDDLIIAVEVANDSDSLWDELKQARKYAGADPRAVPMVALPTDHPGEPLRSYLAERTEAVFNLYQWDPNAEPEILLVE